MCITGHCMTMYVLNGFGILGTCTGELESKDFSRLCAYCVNVQYMTCLDIYNSNN